MANFLLWNVQRKPLDADVMSLAADHDIDAAFLVEYPRHGTRLPDLLREVGFDQAESSGRFGVFSRRGYRLNRQTPLSPSTRSGYWRIVPPSGRDGLLALTHGIDRRNYDDLARAVQLRRVAEEVRFLELVHRHQRTVVCGDFNANPFEPAVTGVSGLHAIGARQVRGKRTRRVHQTDEHFFYNPMWRLYGHGPDAASATHYHPGSGACEHVWHMLDQVVVRPAALEMFPERDVRIITTAAGRSLLTARGTPDARGASDHLPVSFRWDL